MRKFYKSERDRQERLISSGFFGEDAGNGFFKGKSYPFILSNGLNNLYEPIREDALRYFSDNHIDWWGGKTPTGHVLSSQIACINHLMAIRKDSDAVLAMINGIRNQFKAVLPVAGEADMSYIAFEAVSSTDHLNEGTPRRGSNCTSIDALVVAVDHDNKTWLLPIEWKYTESYSDYPSCDKSNEDRPQGKGENGKGKERLSRYNHLIETSGQLKSLPFGYQGSIYYFEPFYQLMRQTLWAEQMVAYKNDELIKADNYLHIHVVPKADTDLLDKRYRLSNKNMEDTWRGMLTDQSKYVIIDPSDLMSPLKTTYPELIHYLESRYYNK